MIRELPLTHTRRRRLREEGGGRGRLLLRTCPAEPAPLINRKWFISAYSLKQRVIREL